MGLFDKIQLFQPKEVEESTQEEEQVKPKTGIVTIPTTTFSTSPTIVVSDSNRFVEHFKSLKQNDAFGKFIDTFEVINKLPLNDQQKYETAFAGFIVQGITIDQILSDGDKYLQTIENENDEFQNAIENKTLTEVTGVEEEISGWQQQIVDLTKKIQDAQVKVNESRNSIATSTVEFSQAFQVSKQEVEKKISNIKTYLYASK